MMQAVSLCSPKIYEVQSWHLIEQNQFFALNEKDLESIRDSLSPGYARPAPGWGEGEVTHLPRNKGLCG